ncbi:MAG: tRNA pseudouridine(38-40) synthase TruA [Chlamydiia bacterium]|nr:tRNA pseudouridine(38-40) synthase TruA [Chlamydiia bacterium]
MDQDKHVYRMTIAYDGTDYSGWQMQPNADSIQARIEDALRVLTRADVRVIGSGRTDAGVHARGQVAHFKHGEKLDLRQLHKSLNGVLPKDIRIKHLSEAPANFHAQYSAQGKVYHYYLHLDPVLDPFLRRFSHHVRQEINRELLHLAAQQFVGTHDFSSFANSASEGSAAKNPVRTIYRIDIVPTPGGVCLEFEGNGFLYKMVRNIVGTCLDVAKGKLALESIPHIFAAKDRREASLAAPALGLFLMEVKYPL